MGRNLKVDGGVVSSLSSRLVTVGDQVERARSLLLSGTTSLGRPWGENDEFARKFSGEYLPGSEEVLEGSANLSTFLKGMGNHIRASGDSFDSVENS